MREFTAEQKILMAKIRRVERIMECDEEYLPLELPEVNTHDRFVFSLTEAQQMARRDMIEKEYRDAVLAADPEYFNKHPEEKQS